MSTAANVTPMKGRIPQWTFAERARKVRRDLGLTQQSMADLLEVGLKAYSAWESGKNSPESIIEIAQRFERVSGVPKTWFLGWGPEDAPGGGSTLHGVGTLIQRRIVGRTGLEPVTDGLRVAPVTDIRTRKGA